MAFVNLTVKTQKAVFEAGTVAGNWKFWIIDPNGDIISGPQETPNESIMFFVDDSAPTRDQIFTAYVVRVDGDGEDLGPIAETPFTVSEDVFVILDVAGGIRVEAPSPPSGPPENTLPGGGRPGNALPGRPPGTSGEAPNLPGNALPGRPPGTSGEAPNLPGNALPGGRPARPGNALPGEQPGIDNTLPGGRPARPGNALPGEQPGIDNTLPGGPPDTTGGQLPPTTATPT